MPSPPSSACPPSGSALVPATRDDSPRKGTPFRADAHAFLASVALICCWFCSFSLCGCSLSDVQAPALGAFRSLTQPEALPQARCAIRGKGEDEGGGTSGRRRGLHRRRPACGGSDDHMSCGLQATRSTLGWGQDGSSHASSRITSSRKATCDHSCASYACRASSSTRLS
jgi:hypothetical protein